MPQVPQYGREVSPQNTPMPYRSVSINSSTFGADIAHAANNLSKSLSDITINSVDLIRRIEDTKNIEFSNFHHDWEQQNLYDKDNGYFYKLGKDAFGKSKELLQKYDKDMNDYIEKAGFTPSGKQRALYMLGRLRERVQYNVNAHDFNQGKEWSKNETALKINNLLSDAYNYRNNPDELKKFLNTGYQALEWEGEISHADRAVIDLSKQKYQQDFHAAVLSGIIEDNSLRAKEYLDENKKFLSPDKIRAFESAINKMEMKYNSNAMTAQILSSAKSEEEALSMVDDIKDEDIKDYVRSKVTSKFATERRLQQLAYNDLIDKTYSNFVNKLTNGQSVNLEDIEDGLKGRDYLNALNAIDSLNKTGDVITDDDTMSYLWNMSHYDAQRFKTLDLKEYRLSLSQKDYDDLIKRQESIQSGKYITTLHNTSATLSYIEQVTGINSNKEELFTSYNDLLRAYELRTGEAATDSEKEKILQSLGVSKDVFKKEIIPAIKANADIYKNVANNISYYQSQHNNEMPDSKTINQWLREECVEYNNKKFQKLKQQAIENINPPKPENNLINKILGKTEAPQPKLKAVKNEQYTLTDFADNFVPNDLSANVGAKLKISSRYRASNGKYNSKHSEGRALDISYLTKEGKKLTLEQKTKLLSEVIKDERVEKVAVSSKDKDGKQMIDSVMKKLGKKFGSKIQDTNTTGIDKKLGTDHTTHIHITLKKDNTIIPQNEPDRISQKSTIKNKVQNELKNKGYSDKAINEFLAEMK